MSSKVVEANAGIHSLAMAVAVRVGLNYYFSVNLWTILACHQLASVWCVVPYLMFVKTPKRRLIRFHLYRTLHEPPEPESGWLH